MATDDLHNAVEIIDVTKWFLPGQSRFMAGGLERCPSHRMRKIVGSLRSIGLHNGIRL